MAFLDFLPTIGGALNTLWNSTVGMNQSKSLMRYQAQLNQQAIDVQNRYNSPIAQMERLRQAGLNPNLVYGNGVDGNQSSAASVGSAPRAPQADFDFADSVSNVFRRRQIENETRLTAANEQKILADKLLSQARYLDIMQEVARKDATFDTYVQQARANLEHTQQSIEESRQRVNESVQRVSNLVSQANLLQEQIRYWDAHATNERDYMPNLLLARTHQALESGNLSQAQQGVARSLISLNNAKVDELLQVIQNLKLDGGNKAIEYELNKRMSNIGMEGVKPKDLLVFLKDIILQLTKD
jgi:hypothetical protein